MKLKVYLSVPMVANRALDRATEIAKAIEDSGNELTSPWVLGELERIGYSGVNVFRRDLSGSEGCDCLVADVGSPSIGVGMEIMAAHKAGKKVLLLAKEGAPLSGMLKTMDGAEILNYSKDSDVYALVKAALQSLN